MNLARKILAKFTIVAVMGLLAACAAPAPPDTPELRMKKAKALADMQLVAGGAYQDTLDRGASLALEATTDALTIELGRELSDEQALEVEAVMRSAIAGVLTPDRWAVAAAELYAAHFTVVDLEAAIEFYSSPVGASILEMQATLDARMGDAVEGIIDAELGSLTAAIDSGLADLFPELAEEERQ